MSCFAPPAPSRCPMADGWTRTTRPRCSSTRCTSRSRTPEAGRLLRRQRLRHLQPLHPGQPVRPRRHGGARRCHHGGQVHVLVGPPVRAGSALRHARWPASSAARTTGRRSSACSCTTAPSPRWATTRTWTSRWSPTTATSADRGRLDVSVTVASSAPADAAKLPKYITGFGRRGSPRAHRLAGLPLCPGGRQDHQLPDDLGAETSADRDARRPAGCHRAGGARPRASRSS